MAKVKYSIYQTLTHRITTLMYVILGLYYCASHVPANYVV